MIVSLFHVQVPAEMVGRFEQSWRQRAGQVDKMPGFLGLEVLRDGATPGKYIVLTRWDSKEDFERWATSPEFAAGHARRDQSGAQGGGVEFYEVLLDNGQS
jgi:heme-degrading monooxygenase HmoA